jgi:hypothetical protein
LSFAFLTCTLNSTNQILHPCILVALFRDHNNEARSDVDGSIPWNPVNTAFLRFYADGAAKPEAGQLITKIAGAEMYFVIDALERLLSPRGYEPNYSLHGIIWEIVRENWGEMSGISMICLRKECEKTYMSTGAKRKSDKLNNEDEIPEVGNRPNLIYWERLLSKLMRYGLSHNGRLNAVLSPCIVVDDKPAKDGSILIRPNTSTRFFTDDNTTWIVHLSWSR